VKELVVISGKGGTGKTSLVASFAALARSQVLADCDVDAADLHLVLNPKVQQTEDFSGGKVARIVAERCTACGRCREVCRFDAVSEGEAYSIDPVNCEGCGVCVWNCPEEAILFEAAVNGQWFISETRHGPMVHARLGIAEENSGKLVTLVRSQARRIAEEGGRELVIVDGSPGIGCPVIASITGTDLVLVVTEPTLSGKHDMERVAELTRHFGIPTMVCVNKWDLYPTVAESIEKDALDRGMKVAGKVRYDRAVTRAQVAKTSVVEYTGGAITEEIKSVWRHILYALG
jgi:MinD superfamily P-loop ATPase